MKRMLLAVALASFVGPVMAQQADLITFEPSASGYLPDGTLAVDNLNVTSQYQQQYGASFGIDANSDLTIDPGSSLKLESKSNANGGWGYVSTYASQKQNAAAEGFESQLGDWFLTNDRGAIASDRLLVTYDNPVNAAAGEIWDVDGRSDGSLRAVASDSF